MTLKTALLDIYRANPCRTLPNAFWKTAIRANAMTMDLQRDGEGQLQSLALLEGSRLMAFWCQDGLSSPFLQDKLRDLSFALVHQNALSLFEGHAFSRRDAYFRLLHQGQPDEAHCPPGFDLITVKPEDDVQAVADLIGRCYEGIQINSSIVRSWLSHPVYDPGLWIWIVEQKTGARVALGIAECDSEVPEVSLEWIQVLPSFRQKGLGKVLVSALLRRAFDRVDFVTVAGRVDNQTRPDILYRRCGFSGNDIWWLLASDSI